jgi:hypothetical protein
MPGLVLTPPQYAELAGPLVFLAGPIQGTSDWHADAIRLLHQLDPELHVASPRRAYAPGEFVYAAQVDWETYHLRRAGADGVILFWLANEVEHDCGRSYAQTTRFELAEWKVRHERDGAKLVVGVGGRFSGARYIRRRFDQDCPGVPVVGSLDAACRAAVRAARPGG